MALQNRKITNYDISTKGVIAAPDKLTGTANENKAVFDRLIREVVKDVVNNVIDDLTGASGASEIGFNEIEGLGANNVQAAITALKVMTDGKAEDGEVSAELELKAEKSDTDLHIKDIVFDAATGVITFTRQNGMEIAIDTALEKVATNWEYVDTPDHPQSLKLTLADGSVQYISLSSFITETEFVDSATIDFAVNNHVVTATIKAGSITDSMLSSVLYNMLSEYAAAAGASASSAATSAAGANSAKSAAERAKNSAESAESAANQAKTLATEKSLVSEGFAVGTQNGVAVGPGSAYYHNNAKYYSEQAGSAVEGGAINTIKVNGVEQEIIDKTVDITVPTQESVKAAYAKTMTVTLSGWVDNEIVVADPFFDSGDFIYGVAPVPTRGNVDAWNDAEILANVITNGQMVFSAKTTPSVDIECHIKKEAVING